MRRVVLMGILLRQLGVISRLGLYRLNSNLLLILSHLKIILYILATLLVGGLVMLFVLLLLTELMKFALSNRFRGPLINFKAHLVELYFFMILLIVIILVNLMFWRGEPKGLLPFFDGLCLSHRLILSFNLWLLKDRL